MKKIFYFIASAIVALGAVACQNDIEEGIDAGQQTEGLSITANIGDMTRVAVEDSDDANYDKKLTWEGNETLTTDKINGVSYEFTNTPEAPHTFTCTQDGVEAAFAGIEETTFYFNDDVYTSGDYSLATDNKSFYLMGEYTKGSTSVEMELWYAVFHFTCDEPVTLKYYNPTIGQLWGWNSEYTFPAGEHYVGAYVSNNGAEHTLEAWIDGVMVKSITREFPSSKIYNLGHIEPEVCIFGIVGEHQGWDAENKDKMYKIAGTNTYAKKNVTLAAGGFKFLGDISKMVTVEHPAVTTGEEGDWYLVPNTNWKKDNARFAIYFFGTSGNTWVSMKDENGDGIYVGNNPASGTYQNMIFCRMNPSTTENNWDNKWNQTNDLAISAAGENNCYTVKSGTWDNGGGTWSVHVPEIKDAWTEEVEEITSYWVGSASDNGDSDGWVQRWSNNLGNDNITVANTSKTYDIYFSTSEEAEWGFEIYYTVLEHGSPAPELK